MEKYNNNIVNSNIVINVNEGETAVICSEKCQQSICCTAQENADALLNCKSAHIPAVCSQCVRVGYPNDYIIFDLKTLQGKAYISTHNTTRNFAYKIEEALDEKNQWQLYVSKVRVLDTDNKKRSTQQPEQQ